MLADYGFGLFALLPYREHRRGPWRLVRHLPSIADGYVSPMAVEGARHVLYHRRTPWMSTGLMERESHAYHVHAARGAVVVAGLGLAMYAHAIAAKADVERVIVIEICADVIELMRIASGWDTWPDRRKMLILHADARQAATAGAVAECLDGGRPDYLFADIWRRCDEPQAPEEMAAMVRMFRPRQAGWWGQELAFAAWARASQADESDANVATEGLLRTFFAETGVPVPLTSGYAAFCRDVTAASDPSAKGGGARTRLRRLWRGAIRSASER